MLKKIKGVMQPLPLKKKEGFLNNQNSMELKKVKITADIISVGQRNEHGEEPVR